MLLNDFVDVLQLADIVVLTPILGSREPNDPSISSAKLAAKLPNAVLVDSLEAAAQWVKQNAQEGDLVITLGCGDAFHLVPRAIALCTTGLESYTAALGIGKLITSVTMTAFYVLLYYVWRSRYEVKGRSCVTATVWVLAAARIALCLFPQNAWTSADAPLSWGIYRNIPFLLLGALIVVLFYRSAKQKEDKPFRLLWLTVALI